MMMRAPFNPSWCLSTASVLGVMALAFAASPGVADGAMPVPVPRPPTSVVDVVDGDTFHARPSGETPACTRLRYGKWESIRVLGLDTPEMRGKCAIERQGARAAKARLAGLLASGRVTIERDGCDRYQRTLARVLVDGRDVAETLIAEGLGRPYEGGRRAGWCGDGGLGSPAKTTGETR